MSTSERRAIADIIIGARHRKDLGDLDALAESIRTLGLLQPIGIHEDLTLVFGHRRLLACVLLGWTEIDVRIVNVSSIALGEMTENEVRKNFTESERVAIFRTIETVGQGTRTDTLRVHGHKVPILTTDDAAKRSGFSGRGTAYRATTVVDKGIPEVVQAMDDKQIGVQTAWEIAKQPKQDQPALLEKAKAVSSKTRNKPKAPPKAPAKPRTTPQKPIDISHIVGHPPTLSSEEAGITPDMTWEEEAQHIEKYGKAQITPKAVRDMQDARALITSRTENLEMMLSDTRPDPDAFFEALNAMLRWTTDQRKPHYVGKGWETDYARMARLELAKLRQFLPKAKALLESYSEALASHDLAAGGNGVVHDRNPETIGGRA